MADIVTSRIFADGEKNITAAKLNDIVGSSVIQPAFVSAKPSTSTVAPTDNLLVLQAAGGAYAKAPFQTVIDSVNANLNTNAAIWSVRLRSFQALGNNTFEVAQRNAGNVVTSAAGSGGGQIIEDRWMLGRSTSAMALTLQRVASGAPSSAILLPGTNFAISNAYMRVTLTTAQATLAATDLLRLVQNIEGPYFRELSNDVHSVSLLVRSSVAGLKFSIGLRSLDNTQSLVKLCTIPTANVWTLIQLPNIPVWAPGGNFSTGAGVVGYCLDITLAAGTTYTAPAADTWQSGLFMGAPGMSSFVASPVNSTYDLAYVSHEPGALCSNPPLDCPFTQNYEGCLRYYQKSVPYTALTSANGSTLGLLLQTAASTAAIRPNVTFKKPMAKAPAVTYYNGATANQVYLDGIGATAMGAITADDSRVISSVLAAAQTVAANTIPSVLGNWIADTGW
jgi:hypothetical protein